MIEFFKNFFNFESDHPLTFVRIDFWIFFALVYAIFVLIFDRKHVRNLFLLLASFYFYYKASGMFVLLLVFSTLTDFYLGHYIYAQTDERRRKIAVTISVCLNLLVLFYFKYAYFFTDSYNALFHTHHQTFNYLAYWANGFSNTGYFTVDKIILPVGISFYTFQTISYTVDIYRHKLPPLRSILDFGFYVSFFPQLVAGPIVRAEEFVPQILQRTYISRDDFNKAIFLILKGLIKKMIFADFIALHFLDRVFDAPTMHSGFEGIMALIGYSLQIYGDFSGYTDIAIGVALLMGFQLPVNFNSPYKALNCGDFWKRWHISLSTWLKDYLYIPLGGNRNASLGTFIFGLFFAIVAVVAVHNLAFTIIIGVLLVAGAVAAYYFKDFEHAVITNINIMLTMLIGGLWHGASWKFVIWGGLNGLGVVAYKYWRKVSPYEHSTRWIARFWKITFTFVFITFTRIFFRSTDMEAVGQWFGQVAHNMNWAGAMQVIKYNNIPFMIILIGYITHWLPQKWKDHIEHIFAHSHYVVKGAIAVVVVLICYQAYSTDLQAFIYFQF
ncbi:D-alanyl-lipoteichoic acid acyltransferase DltB, MBOAT superfamily [Capnocytophaga haemolytica]|uniref:Alginate O-acetyltransferase n=1 Tax=Capnocytophaga haemolytica TaxID=45243 RepID=A0AAX2H1J3_9FLAO|nr:MBOAT family O-acyltransferase [Capnocytophaga haemolytica]AMD86017.1 alginate O-acetyltransferase [Capnocytophaga haemolytica]SFO16920.1 D-alanyl-lipoteichoic acid acyltransferase DltB, MBOAT superfamily [Capnocytophaga haemolytica]SNV14770.1 D-alanyl-lipoteichoic acid biosynthesis protein DltB [Capnocytophaga haemolytica]